MKHLMLLWMLGWVATVQAQDLVVVATTPAHGDSEVDPATPVSITFNKAINPADSLLIAPLDTLLLEQLRGSIRVDLSPDGKTITFHVTHEIDRDYTWLVHYAKATDGSRLAQRYVLHYTTAAAAGPYTLSGQLVEGQGGPGKQPLTRPRFSAFQFAPLARTPQPTPPPALKTFMSLKTLSAFVPSFPIQSSHLGNWYVALFTEPDAEEPIRVGVSNPDGTFSIEYVRPGTYYLMAFFFGAELDEPIGFGFYDPDRDGSPDSLQVSEDLSGLIIPVILANPLSALEAAQIAQTAFTTVASDAQIVMLMGSPAPDGRALRWDFTAYSASQQTAYTITIEGMMPPQQPQALPSPTPFDQMAPLPLNSMVDSDVIAAAYRNRFSDNYNFINLQAGQLAYYYNYAQFIPIELYPLDPNQSIWIATATRMLELPLVGVMDYVVAYDLNGNELLTYEPATAVEALQAAWQQVAPPGKHILQSDGIIGLEGNNFDPYSGKASLWGVRLVAGGQAFELQLSNTLVIHIDTLDIPEWINAPKIPFPIVDSDQAVNAAGGSAIESFFNTHLSIASKLQGGFLAEEYGLPIDPDTPLYVLEFYSEQPQDTLRRFIHMQTGEVIPVAREAFPESAHLTLREIYPNPATHTAAVVVQVPQPQHIRLIVYNLLGQEVVRLVDHTMAAGEYRLQWPVEALPNGLYWVRLQGAESVQTLPVIVMH